MEEPDFLSFDLKKYSACTSDRHLFQSLLPHLDDLIAYFESACDDAPWVSRHREFIRLLLRWSSKFYFSGRLSRHKAKEIVTIMRKNAKVVSQDLLFLPSLYYTVKIKIEKEIHEVNCLLFGVESDYFRNLFKASFENFSYFCTLKSVNLSNFHLIKDYMINGVVGELWRQDYNQLKSLMRLARIWFLPGLIEKCSEIIKRYLDMQNIADTILEAHRQQYLSWKHEAFYYFNEHEKGLQFIPSEREHDLHIEIINLKHDTINAFLPFTSEVTHLTLDTDLLMAEDGRELIEKCSKLKGLDISGSVQPFLNVRELPGSLIELNISACSWLNANLLRILTQHLRYLKKIELAGNVHLSFSAWSELGRFPHLTSLNLAGCHQLKREDLNLLGRSCPHLLELSLEECRQLEDQELIELILLCPHLKILNLSGCSALTDKALNELSIRSYQLETFICIRTNGFSEEGIDRFVRQRPSLHKINIRNNSFSLKFIVGLKQEFPFIQIEN